MQEPEQSGVNGADEPEQPPTAFRSPDTQQPNWPVAGARPPAIPGPRPETSAANRGRPDLPDAEPGIGRPSAGSETPAEQPGPSVDAATIEAYEQRWDGAEADRAWERELDLDDAGIDLVAGPVDWPPDDLPAPEDEPTEPIEGLVEANPIEGHAGGPEPVEPLGGRGAEAGAGGRVGPGAVEPPGGRVAGTDEPTLELPIIGGPADSGPPPPGRRWLVGAGVAATLLVLAGAGAVVFGSSGPDVAGYRAGAAASASVPGTVRPTPPVTTAPTTAQASPSSTAVGPLDGRTKAGFDVVNGAAAISLRTADLGADLYRISAPAGSPRVTEEDGRVRLYLDDGAPPAVDVVLSSRIRWDLRIGGGTEMSTIDLSGARLSAVDLSGGAGRIVLTLPKPDGTLTVQLSGGVNRFDVHTAGTVPVRVRLGSGAGQVVLDGTSHNGVAAGALFTTASWDGAVDRIDLDAVAGMSAMTVGP